MAKFEENNIQIDPKEIDLDWSQLITDEQKMLEAGYPLELIAHWVDNNILEPFSVDNQRQFYTQDVFKATVYQAMEQQSVADNKEVMD
ncbi:hypothetical protein [Staphylococcus pettenkoferi]|uniref:hypothetical protein n=1 Tax=Staphylococcus pettenkoferi TaxID=170573 RepID=UPI0011A7A197|nr:hypothetical protein [Staphylococcus pettenkoferi]